jgi:uncharacterized protein
LPFFEGTREASRKFGWKTLFSLSDYRSLIQSGAIHPQILSRILAENSAGSTHRKTIEEHIGSGADVSLIPETGHLRKTWKKKNRIELNSFVHPILFRTLCQYLDQGVAIWEFPLHPNGFLASLRELERSAFSSLFQTREAKSLLLNDELRIEFLLDKLVENPAWFESYLFDQQFAHPGWSGLVAVVENQKNSLLAPRPISLHDFIVFELLLEWDNLQARYKNRWKSVAQTLGVDYQTPKPEADWEQSFQVRSLLQEAFEWSYFDAVVAGLEKIAQSASHPPETRVPEKTPGFQAIFCIDDRECSFRRYLEELDPRCQTYGTPGFFGVEFFFQPQGGKFVTKVCPAPVTPGFLVKELGVRYKGKRDLHFSKHSHNVFLGWFISQTLGFSAGFRLFLDVFRPSLRPASSSSLRHMDPKSKLTVRRRETAQQENGLYVGFSIQEMADRVERVLKSMGMVRDFGPLIYVVGHGASSVNNPHYAAYDCGACSGRAGSVNARVFAQMGNDAQVRKILAERGILIPDTSQFVGALRDTTRDEIRFFDLEELGQHHSRLHQQNHQHFQKASHLNAKERSRRFDTVNSGRSAEEIHREVLLRSISLFEPRPELNHATNAICLIGRREWSRGLFLDRRSFLNSYDYRHDPRGELLLGILQAAAPVCGGINLEYFFSKTDNHNLGAGSKLPHNVMGLVGVANGIDGDLRPGLPAQMVEMHDPLRLLMVVEHFPDVVLETARRHPATWAWFAQNWIHLVAFHPKEKRAYRLKKEAFELYTPLLKPDTFAGNLSHLFESSSENIPVLILKPA